MDFVVNLIIIRSIVSNNNMNIIPTYEIECTKKCFFDSAQDFFFEEETEHC